ncbi:acyl transferase/acyl hydrolase/lysophospholipase [Diplogelasinospora grovesii]|uniref:Lysophospholipase n=1 Tax=Diplogelasinospora grovesii TaxID=303347 RepID=A0AAN6MV44_9PEZI|nr:acyl transferase/acyl hydrolase/lysophospholipase [Diplogelasinospora grovesii]
MPLLTTIRQSPAYLYLKTYCLCALVTLFQATPVSSRLPQIEESLHLNGFRVARAQLGQRSSVVKSRREISKERRNASSREFKITTQEPATPSQSESRARVILRRWLQRAVDLSQVKKQLRRDNEDRKTYPETEWDATVRRSSALHPKETAFIELRQQKISSHGANSLHSFLGLPEGEKVDPRDVPLIALGGSGGGYRAMYGFTAFISGCKELGLWDCITWAAGVSGSCWTLAHYYTIAYHDASDLARHYLAVAKEPAHPLSIRALNTVARSSRGVYFLIGPLVRKAQSGIIGLGIMDLYATLTTTYQLLSREQPGRTRLSRATFQFSKVWTRSGIEKAEEPMPFLTAVRKAPRGSRGVEPHEDSSASKGEPPKRALTQHQTNTLHMAPTHEDSSLDSPFAKGFFQWFEISPLEVGSPDAQGYIPTWSWGRSFVSGRSVGRPPEQHLSLLLGQCTSAPAGPLTGYISALLASLPKGTMMSRILLLLNNFARMKRWEGLWGNPIRAGHDPNPFYGVNTRSSPDNPTEKWELQGRTRLMDSGMSNNLPNHILARPERGADIIIAFDASSDVQKGSAIRRIQNFADDCHIADLEDVSAEFHLPQPRFSDSAEKKAELESKFLHQYVRVFRGRREHNGRELYVVYCPLLPNAVNPDFNPSTASFSNSYNLVWTPEQIRMLFATSEANLTCYAIGTIRQVVRQVYLAKKAQRKASILSSTGPNEEQLSTSGGAGSGLSLST